MRVTETKIILNQLLECIQPVRRSEDPARVVQQCRASRCRRLLIVSVEDISLEGFLPYPTTQRSPSFGPDR